jgi:two-component system phosphate regulon sensor histidine kinase PhoR
MPSASRETAENDASAGPRLNLGAPVRLSARILDPTRRIISRVVALLYDFSRGIFLRLFLGHLAVAALTVAAATVWTFHKPVDDYDRIVRLSGLALSGGVLLSLVLSYLWSAPVRRITKTARSISQGDLSARVEVHGNNELSEMGRWLNRVCDSLSEQLQTLDAQRRQHESLIGTLTEGVLVTDGEGRIVLINPVARRLLFDHAPPVQQNSVRASCLPDATDACCVGRHVDECIAYPELREMLRSVDGADKQSASAELRFQMTGRDGAISLLARAADVDLHAPKRRIQSHDRQEGVGSQSGRPQPSGRNRSLTVAALKGRMVVLTDITELTRAIQMKTDFVANASHEFRTPISALRASVETLLDVDPVRDPSSARRFIEMIDRHSRRLEDLVNDLLDLSRLETPGAAFPPVEIRLLEFIGDLHMRYADALAARGLRWRADCPADCDLVTANPTLLRLVLDNLVDNAVKFSESGEIRVACRRGDEGISIEVSDQGCGIPVEEQDRVFERFYQARPDAGQLKEPRASARAVSPSPKGSGLGLAIVRHAVAAMYGLIRLDSKPGQGTTVALVIPQPDRPTGAPQSSRNPNLSPTIA